MSVMHDQFLSKTISPLRDNANQMLETASQNFQFYDLHFL